MTREKRVLPADVYDTLELSALAFGGIGAHSAWEQDAATLCSEADAINAAPLCALGHIAFAAALSYEKVYAGRERPFPIDEVAYVTDGIIGNDNAVNRINTRRKRVGDSRVTFKQWCKELNVIRGA